MKKHIVLIAGVIGGAEKRFFDIFRASYERDSDVFLVISSGLLSFFKSEYDLKKYQNNIITIELDDWSPIKFIFKFYNQILRRSDPLDVFHYPTKPLFFLHLLTRRKFTISLCNCHASPSLSLVNKPLLLQYFAIFFAEKIDVLNPEIHADVIAKLPKLIDKISLTPGGTFVYPCDFDIQVKDRVFSYVGRLEKDKGLDVMFKIIPWIHKIDSSISFEIYGEGALRGEVEEKVRSLQALGMNVDYHGYVEIREVLRKIWCVFSLQTITNFPSRVVAESLLNGCEVIVLDSGDSRNFGDPSGLYYLKNDLSDLEVVVKGVVSRLSYTNTNSMREIAQSATHEFCSESYIDYFQQIFSSDYQSTLE